MTVDASQSGLNDNAASGLAYITFIPAIIFRLTPFIGWTMWFVMPLIWLVFFIFWLIALINAFNGKRFKLPIVGDLAEKQANG